MLGFAVKGCPKKGRSRRKAEGLGKQRSNKNSYRGDAEKLHGLSRGEKANPKSAVKRRGGMELKTECTPREKKEKFLTLQPHS